MFVAIEQTRVEYVSLTIYLVSLTAFERGLKRTLHQTYMSNRQVERGFKFWWEVAELCIYVLNQTFSWPNSASNLHVSTRNPLSNSGFYVAWSIKNQYLIMNINKLRQLCNKPTCLSRFYEWSKSAPNLHVFLQYKGFPGCHSLELIVNSASNLHVCL